MPTPPSSTTITWSTTGAGARVATSCSDREYGAEIQSDDYTSVNFFVKQINFYFRAKLWKSMARPDKV